MEKAENNLFKSKRIKFKKYKDWRKENVPDEGGIYAILENFNNLIKKRK
ncbi:hypothetical protein PXD56_02540 [Maribacter sp. SA7]|nr:hypothetical protein [Maribacter zhoushanensis]MDF4201815.1 hypothetical protein [Maribacter zhoushanensis]